MARFLRACALLVMPAALGLTAGGCLGQSGSPPTCEGPQHCLCQIDFASRIRGTVVSTDGVRVEVLVQELPEDPDKYSYLPLAVGMTIGGELSRCETPPDHAPGTEVLVFNYGPGNVTCPEFEACIAQEDSNAQYEACVESEREACSVYDDEERRNGYLVLAVEADGVYDFGEDTTAPAVIAVSEAGTLDQAACDARFPPPPPVPCDDTPWIW